MRGLRRPIGRGARLVSAAALLVAFAAPAAAAEILAPGRFGAQIELVQGPWRVLAARSDQARARAAAHLLDELAARVESRLGLPVPDPVTVFLAPTERRFVEAVRALTAARDPPAWAIAVAVPARAAIVIHGPRLRAAAPREIEHTLAHELAHLALWRVGDRMPRWFEEGLAQWAADEPLDPGVRNHLARFARLGTLDDLSSYERDFPAHGEGAQLTYALAHAFVAWLAETFGEQGLRRCLALLDEGLVWREAFERGLGVPPRGAELVFRTRLAEHYNPWRDLASTEGLFVLMALLVLVAFARYRWRRRRLLAAMDAEEQAGEAEEGSREPRRRPPPPPAPLPFRPGTRPDPL